MDHPPPHTHPGEQSYNPEDSRATSRAIPDREFVFSVLTSRGHLWELAPSAPSTCPADLVTDAACSLPPVDTSDTRTNKT